MDACKRYKNHGQNAAAIIGILAIFAAMLAMLILC
jgi:hypothetical protein